MTLKFFGAEESDFAVVFTSGKEPKYYVEFLVIPLWTSLLLFLPQLFPYFLLIFLVGIGVNAFAAAAVAVVVPTCCATIAAAAPVLLLLVLLFGQMPVSLRSGATAAIKLVGEDFPFSGKSSFFYLRINHNSVLGVR